MPDEPIIDPNTGQPVATPVEGGAGVVTPSPAQPEPAGAAASPSGAEPPAGRFVPLDRFNGVVAQKYEAIRQAEQATARARELEQQLESFRARTAAPIEIDPATGQPKAAPVAPPQSAARAFDPAEIDRLATQRAQQMNFKERVDAEVSAGRKAHPDFDATIAELQKVAPMRDASGAPMIPPSLVEAAVRTGKGAEVLYALGKDTLEADRVMSLDPIGQAVEIARLAAKFESPSAPAAPAEPAAPTIVRGQPPEPIRPVVGAARGKSYDDLPLDSPELPIEEWMKRRETEVARNRKANGRFGALR